MNIDTENKAWIFSVLVLLAGLTLVFFFYVPKPQVEVKGGLRKFAEIGHSHRTQKVAPAAVDITPAKSQQQRREPQLEPMDEQPKADEHPHPITPSHTKLFKANARMGQVLGAIDVADAQGLRKLSQLYKEDSPDEVATYAALDVIADCIETNDEQSAYNAQLFYDTERASRLRRYVRRFCFK